MGATVGIILIVIALANDCFQAWLNWRSDLNNGKGSSGIPLVSVALYAAGAFLIRRALWTSGVMTAMLTLCAALVFHGLFILAMTRIIHACAGTRKRDLPGA